MEDTTAVFGAWPGDADVAVALTFDVDGEAAWLAEGPEYGRRLTLLSQARFGPGRGLGRILDLLAELEIPGSFYVPGHTADHHPEAVAAIVTPGHEVGHHGYWTEIPTASMAPPEGRAEEGQGAGAARDAAASDHPDVQRGRPWFATHAQIAALANPPARPHRLVRRSFRGRFRR